MQPSPLPVRHPMRWHLRWSGRHAARSGHIADRLREKAAIRAIAAELGRSPSTISREIRRNRTVLPDGTW
ncbi:helix-turn-helix domain-containing protein [Streptomyces sp. NPDC004296]|uniref:helix-turn-helix domain-containing protein n=1 Tax=Streptomyces sp. NPDC004296 TaxID=3364697 RepID=UPI0036CD5271